MMAEENDEFILEMVPTVQDFDANIKIEEIDLRMAKKKKSE